MCVTLDRSSSTSLSGSRNTRSDVDKQNSGRCRSCEPVVRRIFWRQQYIHTWAVYTLFINIGGDDSSFSVAILKWIIIERWHHEREERLAESLGVLLQDDLDPQLHLLLQWFNKHLLWNTNSDDYTCTVILLMQTKFWLTLLFRKDVYYQKQLFWQFYKNTFKILIEGLS